VSRVFFPNPVFRLRDAIVSRIWRSSGHQLILNGLNRAYHRYFLLWSIFSHEVSYIVATLAPWSQPTMMQNSKNGKQHAIPQGHTWVNWEILVLQIRTKRLLLCEVPVRPEWLTRTLRLANPGLGNTIILLQFVRTMKHVERRRVQRMRSKISRNGISKSRMISPKTYLSCKTSSSSDSNCH
jgi:hypothetical protein